MISASVDDPRGSLDCWPGRRLEGPLGPGDVAPANVAWGAEGNPRSPISIAGYLLGVAPIRVAAPELSSPGFRDHAGAPRARKCWGCKSRHAPGEHYHFFSSGRRGCGFDFFVGGVRGPPSGGWRPYRLRRSAACRGRLYGRGQRRRPRRQISLLWFRVRFSRFVRISASLFLFFAVTPASFSAS